MDKTCNYKDCRLHDLLGGEPKDCPNFIETWWKPLEGQAKLVQDCAPKRTLLMVQELYNQQVRLQKAQEQQRNESQKIMGVFEELISHAKQRQLKLT